MERFNSILKDKNKALSIFEKAKKGLNEVIQKMNDAHRESVENQIFHEESLKEEAEAQAFALAEIRKSTETIGKIDAILN